MSQELEESYGLPSAIKAMQMDMGLTMCGIWAIFGGDDELDKHLCACLCIAHRGPDAFRMERLHDLPRCYLGFHHLAIMSTANGMQPLKIRTLPKVWLVYNGQIYNYEELQKEHGFKLETESDGEVLLHLYAKGGAELMAKSLDGVFSFCLVDINKGKVFVGRDTFGVRPSFRFRTDDGMLAVCSEVKGLLDLVPIDGKYHIEPVPPGAFEEYDLATSGYATYRKTVRFNSVGQPPFYKTLVASEESDIYANVRELFTDAVRKRMMSHRRIGCLLSGGLDSSLVTALVVKCAKEMGLDYPIQTFSIGMDESPDLVAAKRVADYLGTEHHVIHFNTQEGLDVIQKVIRSTETYDVGCIRGSIAYYIMLEYIAKETDSTVVFSGEGADEVAQGYNYFRNQPTNQHGHEESLRRLRDLYFFDVLRVDRTTAAHGLEIRVPFLDHSFTSYYLSTPAELRCPGTNAEKYLLRKAFDPLKLIPDDILWRPKEQLSDGISPPKKSWYKILQDHCDSKVSNREMDEAANSYPVNPPWSKEAYFYRQTFDSFYPDCAHLLPYLWVPLWTKSKDPSGRVPIAKDTATKNPSP